MVAIKLTAILGVATTTAALVAAVVAAEEPRRVLVVAQDAVKGTTRVEPTAAALGEAPEGGGTAHEVAQRETARPPPPARLRARIRTTAR